MHGLHPKKNRISDQAELLARAADGSVRDGLSLLDQAIAQTGGKVDEKSVMDINVQIGVIVDFMQTLYQGYISREKSDELYSNGVDLTMLLNDMMEWTHWATRMHLNYVLVIQVLHHIQQIKRTN